jgi:hypothetical protein
MGGFRLQRMEQGLQQFRGEADHDRSSEKSCLPSAPSKMGLTHAAALVNALREHSEPALVQLAKQDGQTVVHGQGLLDEPPWQWPDRG